MSSTDDLKAGHPPAIKVGGMRVTRPAHSDSDKSDKVGNEESVEGLGALKVSTSPPKAVATNISGALARGNADFPPEAVQSFHEKPHPVHDNRAASHKPNIIHQPRK